VSRGESRFVAWRGQQRKDFGRRGKQRRREQLGPSRAEFEPRYEWAKWRAEGWRSPNAERESSRARATDESGSSQTCSTRPERLDGYVANWYHRIRVVVI